MLLADFVRDTEKRLEEIYPSYEARSIVKLLCREKFGFRDYQHIVYPETLIPSGAEEELPSLVERLAKAEPVQYVLGQTEFCGRYFKVSPAVLIPRPETEQLVSFAMLTHKNSGERILDLCTGSGCIAWTIALDNPEVKVSAVDISETALSLARSQFEAENAPQFIQADVLDVENCALFDAESFDLIVSNPPYIMESEKALMHRNVLDYEPEIALFVPDDDPLLFYKALGRWAKRLLKTGGELVVEINDKLAGETEAAIVESGLKAEMTTLDHCARKRFTSFRK